MGSNPQRLTFLTFLPLIGELTADLADGRIDAEERVRLADAIGNLLRVLAITNVSIQPPSQPVQVPPPAAVPQPFPFPPQPIPPAPPATGGRMLPTITKLTAGIIFGERNRDADDAPRKGIEGKRFDWRNEAQGVGDRIHGDCTPEPDNPAENELRVGADGNPKKPWVEPRWGTCNEDGSNERLMWNSTDLDDKFSLESWEKKGPQDTSGPGLTPVLLQNEEIGQGRTKCFLYFVISAEHNNGHALDGSDRDACPRVYWMAS